jgi:hypothetical protein
MGKYGTSWITETVDIQFAVEAKVKSHPSPWLTFTEAI